MINKVTILLLTLLSSSLVAADEDAYSVHSELDRLEKTILNHSLQTNKIPNSIDEIIELAEAGRLGIGAKTYTIYGNIWMPQRSLEDPWGSRFIYKRPSSSKKRVFDLYSAGPNKIDDNGASDDIVAWDFPRNHSSRPSFSSMLPFMLLIIVDGPLLVIVFFIIRFRKRKHNKGKH